MALRNALRDASLYQSLPGYESTGAITVSVFVVADVREALGRTAGIGQSLSGLATVGTGREHGYQVVPTQMEEDGVPLPFSDRHADVVVSAYPEDLPPYDARLPPSERRRIRALLLDEYNRALRVFDPRHEVPAQYYEEHD
jgi:hypothetical protein